MVEKQNLEELKQDIVEELISLENEKEALEKGIQSIKDYLLGKVSPKLNLIPDMWRFFQIETDDEEFLTEEEKRFQRQMRHYYNNLPEDLKEFYLNVCNLYTVLPFDINENIYTVLATAEKQLRKVKKLIEEKKKELIEINQRLEFLERKD
jgi:hypothetical protein